MIYHFTRSFYQLMHTEFVVLSRVINYKMKNNMTIKKKKKNTYCLLIMIKIVNMLFTIKMKKKKKKKLN